VWEAQMALFQFNVKGNCVETRAFYLIICYLRTQIKL
jgi:hypothetical protein